MLVIDVAANTFRFGAFDNIHDATSAAVFSQHIKDAARNSYGVPGRLFLVEFLRPHQF